MLSVEKHEMYKFYMWIVKCKYEMLYKNNQAQGQQQEKPTSHMKWKK